jgi:hypothetical protein
VAILTVEQRRKMAKVEPRTERAAPASTPRRFPPVPETPSTHRSDERVGPDELREMLQAHEPAATSERPAAGACIGYTPQTWEEARQFFERHGHTTLEMLPEPGRICDACWHETQEVRSTVARCSVCEAEFCRGHFLFALFGSGEIDDFERSIPKQ